MDPILKPFEYFEPKTIEEAVQVLSAHKGDARVLAGGTDLLVTLKKRTISPGHIVYIKAIPGLDCIDYTPKGGLRIGALATHRAIANSPIIKAQFNLLATACNKVANPNVRNMGTIGGNICTAGPSQDTVPALLVLDARLKLVSTDGVRLVPINEFFIAPFRTIRNEAELLTEIQIPPLPSHSTGVYHWVTKLTAVDETLVGVAVFMAVDPTTKGACQDVRIGLCSVAPTPVRARRAEELLRGRSIGHDLIERVGQVAAEEISPRSRCEYRRLMTVVLVKRALNEELGVPSVVIDADHMDPRNFSIAQFESRVDAFMEMLLERKGLGH